MHSPVDPSATSIPQTPLMVGREREQTVLRQALDAMQTGHGGLVLVSGEAGIGKTALVEWLAHEADNHGCMVLRGGCYDLTTTPPYGPWIEALASYAPLDSLPPRPAFVGDLEALTALGSQQRLFAAAREFTHAVATHIPLIVCLEDLHWADQASLELLRILGRGVRDQRLLILATYRSDELRRHNLLYRVLPVLVRETRAERLEVHPLDDAAHRALVLQRYDLSDTDQLRQRLGDALTRSPTFPAGLSPREVEVLGLVADGLTDAQIAES